MHDETPVKHPLSADAAQARVVSGIVLALVNLIPAAGVLFWGWAGAVLFTLYWAESVIIGLWFIPRIALARGGKRRTSLFEVLFFILHFGIFMFGYYQFLSGTLAVDLRLLQDQLIPIAALFLSHSFSFFYHFIFRGEFRRATKQQMMRRPYERILPMHLGIILGGILTAQLDEEAGFLLALVLVKTVLDLFGHLREHKREQTQESREVP